MKRGERFDGVLKDRQHSRLRCNGVELVSVSWYRSSMSIMQSLSTASRDKTWLLEGERGERGDSDQTP
jgi:hypothetical protein